MTLTFKVDLARAEDLLSKAGAPAAVVAAIRFAAGLLPAGTEVEATLEGNLDVLHPMSSALTITVMPVAGPPGLAQGRTG